MILSTALKPIAVTIGLGVSNHIGHCDSCNEVHPNIAAVFEAPHEDFEFSIGAFHNSYRKLGIVAGVRWYSTEYTFIDAGFATGYEDQSGMPLTPFGRAGVQVRYDFAAGEFSRHQGWGVSAFVFPSVTKAHRPAIGAGLAFDYRIKF